ncbi:Interferon a3 [Acipenser ruthenus]|uniref:Interferon a3 n=1 Tax=Acipenser ruthenus TaxID=7906 RepID=A0A444UV41_ACIRT|nr:Interferon a3 [Acipenser ruthenus]
MGEELPKDCFTEKDIQIKSELPKKVYGHHLQEGDDVKTVYETFLQIKNIFNKKLISVSWDQKNIESLKIVLHRQTSVLEDCKYSRCAWEMVRNEIKTLLQQVYKLMVKL